MGLILSLNNSIHSFNTGKFVLDQYTGAAAAYSLRRLSVNSTNVVRVRRSSDNAEADFTADEITDGTMTAWVNEEVEKVLNGDFSNGSTNWIVSNGSVTGGEYVSGALSAYQTGIKQVPFTYTGTGTLTFDLTLNSGSLRVDDGGSLKLFTSSGSQSITLTNPSKLEFNAYNLGFDGIIDNISFIPTNVDGYVTTWYDQAGSNDATQGTASSQPKIVDAGVLVEENGNPAIQFDLVNDINLFASTSAFSQPNTIFALGTVDSITGNGQAILDGITSRNLIGISDTGKYQLFAGTSLTSTNNATTNQNLYSALFDGVNSSLYVNEVQEISGNVGSNSLDDIRIGNDANLGVTGSWNGNIQELIIYPSDQSSNRTNIETNINDYYAIYAGIPVGGLLYDYPGSSAAYSLRQLTIYNNGYKETLVMVRRDSDNAEVDVKADANYEISLNSLTSDNVSLGDWIGSDNGFVTTWYDQSGNGNNAVQATAANQPKIVDAGVLVEENGKPAVKFESAQDLFNAYNVQELSTIISISSSLDSVIEQSVYNMHLGDGSRGFSLGYNRNAPNSIGSTTRDPLFVFYQSGEDLPNLNQKLFTQIGSCASGSAFNNLYINSTIGSQLYSCRFVGSGGIAIGSRDGLFYLNGTIQEIISYNSDQSSNRTGIETNINNHYNIYP